MTPVTALERLLQVNRPAAKIILCGLAIFAAVAIIATWKVDFQSVSRVGLVIVVFGAGLTLLAFILEDKILGLVLGWTVTLLFVAISIAMALSWLMPGRTPIAPIPCLFRPMEPCPLVMDEVANRNAAPVQLEPLAVAAPEPAKADYEVSLTFAGYRRSDIVELASALRTVGWNVDGPKPPGGNDRQATASGAAEVRYGSSSSAAIAKALATEIEATGIKPDVTVRLVTGLDNASLQVWVGL